MIRHETGRWYHGERVYPGDPVQGTQKQKEALLTCGQAYDDGEETVTMDNTKKEIEAFLEANEIEYSEYSTKAELLELI